MTITSQFVNARQVGTPLVAIRTFDAASTLKTVISALADNLSLTPLFVWDSVRGIRPVTGSARQVLESMGEIPDTAPISNALILAEQLPQDSILLLSNAHFQTGDPTTVQGVWNLRDIYKERGNMLVLLLSPGAILPAELTHDVLMLDEPLPTRNDLAAIILQTFQDAALPVPDEAVIGEAVNALIGLPSFPAEQASAMSLDRKAGRLNMLDLWERKRESISQIRGLSVWSGPSTEVGGNGTVKTFLDRLMAGKDKPNVVILLDEVEKAFAGHGTDMSGVKTELTGQMLTWTTDHDIDGLMLVGVSGTGKTAIAKWFAAKYGIPLIMFDLAGMQSGIIGSSGENLRAAIKTVNAISGGRVLMIATSNGIESLPPELQGRFALGQFWVEVPDSDERNAIWSIFRGLYGIDSNQPNPDEAGWTGREIREACKKAYRLGISLHEASRYVIPITRSNAAKIAEMRTKASGKYLSASKQGVFTYTPTTSTVSPNAFPVIPDGRKIREMN